MSHRIIRFNHPGDGAWVMARCEGVFNDRIDQVISVHRDGQIVGGVVYSLFLKTAILLHMAGSEDNWATRDFLWVVYDFPFNVLGVTWCLGLVDATNTRALDIDKRMGFREIARLPAILDDGADLIILGMQRHECWVLNNIKPRLVQPRNRTEDERLERLERLARVVREFNQHVIPKTLQ
jgi:hypothetical protein